MLWCGCQLHITAISSYRETKKYLHTVRYSNIFIPWDKKCFQNVKSSKRKNKARWNLFGTYWHDKNQHCETRQKQNLESKTRHNTAKTKIGKRIRYIVYKYIPKPKFITPKARDIPKALDTVGKEKERKYRKWHALIPFIMLGTYYHTKVFAGRTRKSVCPYSRAHYHNTPKTRLMFKHRVTTQAPQGSS